MIALESDPYMHAGKPADPDPAEALDYHYKLTGPIQPIFHSHTQYEIYYFHQGSCNYLIGDRIYILEPGDVILMYGMTLHCAKMDPDVEYVRTIMHFDPAAVKPYLELAGGLNVLEPFEMLRNVRMSLRGSILLEMEQLLGELHRHWTGRDEPVSYNRFQLAFIDLLYFLFEQCQASLQEKKQYATPKEQLVQQIISVLDQSYKEDVHMEDLLSQVPASKSYISKIFKQVTGVTIFQYIYRRRVNEARILFMLEPHLSVTEIGFRLGFKHLAHFSRLFKQQTGMTAEQCRKQAAGLLNRKE